MKQVLLVGVICGLIGGYIAYVLSSIALGLPL